MPFLALATDAPSLPVDFDMPLLVAACRDIGLPVDIREWDSPDVDWSRYDAVVLRSPWDYASRLPEFLAWCERVSGVTRLVNPLPALRWSLDKHYLADLADHGVPIVPTTFINSGEAPVPALQRFFSTHSEVREIVVKPTIGCYSQHVRRYPRESVAEAAEHAGRLLGKGCDVIIQPYLSAIDDSGETDLIYFEGKFSHAIRKSALLMPDGTVNVPAQEFRSPRNPDERERAVASSALDAVAAHLRLDGPLLYGRVDLVRDNTGEPVVLEVEICEPSLSLPFAENSAMRFAQALSRLPSGRPADADELSEVVSVLRTVG